MARRVKCNHLCFIIIVDMNLAEYRLTDTFTLQCLAAEGNADAMETLAWNYSSVNDCVDGDFHEDAHFWAFKRETYWQRRAMDAWRERAEQGDASAWRHMAELLQSGPLFHPIQALKWMHNAAEQGDVLACAHLSKAFGEGDILVIDPEKAEYWRQRCDELRRALAENGDVPACLSLCDEPQWRERMHALAEGGELQACHALAGAYRYGIDPFPEDEAQAAYWQEKIKTMLQTRAEKGNTMACMELSGIAEEAGDVAAVYQWRLLAAELGHDEGAFLLGQAFRHGRGVPKDLEQAYHWLQRAAELGNANALGQCFVLAYSGSRAEKALARQALDALGKADHAEANLILGLMHMHDGARMLSNGNKRAQAIECLEKAFDGGLPEAVLVLGQARYSGDITPKEHEHAIAQLHQAAQAGEDDAQGVLAQLLWDEEDASPQEQPERRKQAVEWMRQSAAAGNGKAALAMLKWLDDIDEESELCHALRDALTDVADMGNATACVHQAQIAYASGIVETDIVARLWGDVLTREIHLENPEVETLALDALTSLARGGETEALDTLRAAGTQPNATPALTLRLAQLYTQGSLGVPADWDEAVRWLAHTCGRTDDDCPERSEAIKQLTTMAEKNSLSAIRALYELEVRGVDTCAKRGRISALLRVAKKGGHPEAMFLAGKLLLLGSDITPPAPLRSAEWFAKAAQKGHKDAQGKFAVLEPFIELFRSAEAGDADALWRVGKMYEDGVLQQDMELACGHYMQATALGHAEAAAHLRQLAETDGNPAAQMLLRELDKTQKKSAPKKKRR